MIKVCMVRFLLVLGLLVSFAGLEASAQDYVTVTKASGDLKSVTAKITINAPPAFVWQTLTSYNELDDFIPGYRSAQLVASSGATKTLDIDMIVSRLLPSYKYRVRVQEDQRRMMLTLQRISGDFKHFNGTYQLVPSSNGARTVLVYKLDLDPGKDVPGSALIIKGNVEKTLAAVREHAESQHRKSMIGKN